MSVPLRSHFGYISFEECCPNSPLKLASGCGKHHNAVCPSGWSGGGMIVHAKRSISAGSQRGSCALWITWREEKQRRKRLFTLTRDRMPAIIWGNLHISGRIDSPNVRGQRAVVYAWTNTTSWLAVGVLKHIQEDEGEGFHWCTATQLPVLFIFPEEKILPTKGFSPL